MIAAASVGFTAGWILAVGYAAVMAPTVEAKRWCRNVLAASALGALVGFIPVLLAVVS